MGLSLFFFSFQRLILWLLFLYFSVLVCFTCCVHSLCHNDEHSALLQFKETMIINKFASFEPSAYPKVASWKADKDCCSWDGVTCNEVTGHLIKLNLTSSCLYGSINSSSSLFHLVHLTWLSLDDNNFNDSKIPSAIKNLSRLSYLSLYNSSFSGQIPSEVLELSKLETLITTFNFNLKLQKPSLRSLVEKLTQLKVLYLGHINISSPIPDILANLSSLTALSLKGCQLQGEFPAKIFQLPNLRILSVRFNPNLFGSLPEFQNNSPLEELRVANTSFFGEIPKSIGNLNSLQILYLSVSNFSGLIPPSLGHLSSLQELDLSSNNLNGTVDMDMIASKLKNLENFNLSSNNISLHIDTNGETKFPKLRRLGLRSCNLNKFPSFLRNQHQLINLDLSSNKIVGKIPRWFFNVSVDSLKNLNLANNLLTGFD